MARIARQLVGFIKKEDGPTAVECALMLALIIVVCVAAISTLDPDSGAAAGPAVVVVQADK